jgi:hypothetical protein
MGNIQQQALQQEGLQRKEEPTQVQDWNVECKNLQSRSQIGKFEKEMQNNDVSVLGVSEVR